MADLNTNLATQLMEIVELIDAARREDPERLDAMMRAILLSAGAGLRAELAIIRARMQAIETTLQPGKCALWECDALYGRQEELKAMLWDMENLKRWQD